MQIFERLTLRRGHYAILASLAGETQARLGSFPGLAIDLAALWSVPKD